MRVGILVLIASLVSGAAQGGNAPQITDPPQDIFLTIGPIAGAPDPSIDLRSVRFERDGDDFLTRIILEDLSFQMPGYRYRYYWVTFHTETHSIMTRAYTHDAGESWAADLLCMTESDQITCWEDSELVISLADSELVIRNPISLLGGRVLEPRVGTANMMTNSFEQVGLKDWAPNCSLNECPPGSNWDPEG